jgi:pyruvyltransferase
MFMFKRLIKYLLYRIWYFIIQLIYRRDVIYLDYRPYHKNFGDEFNLWLVAELSGRRIIKVQSEYFTGVHMMAAGSILDHAKASTIVWGSGLISEEVSFSNELHDIRAVRGKLTYARLLAKGIKCPTVFGDPAMLVPRLYSPRVSDFSRCKVGIVPHYIDKHNQWLNRFSTVKDVKIIDIQQDSIFGFIDDVCSCDIVLSSSLHGLIIADAYKIPNVWIRLSDNVIGGDFKFLDYYSIGVRQPNCKMISGDEAINDLITFAEVTNFNTDFSELMESFPFQK